MPTCDFAIPRDVVTKTSVHVKINGTHQAAINSRAEKVTTQFCICTLAVVALWASPLQATTKQVLWAEQCTFCAVLPMKEDQVLQMSLHGHYCQVSYRWRPLVHD